MTLISVARDAGMKYAVLTAKHTAGHCLWDSKVRFRGKEFDHDVATSGHPTDVVAEFGRLWPAYSFFGVGGRRMAEAGVDLLFSIDALSAVGIFEIIARLPHFRRIFKLIEKEVDARRPAADSDRPAKDTFAFRSPSPRNERGRPSGGSPSSLFSFSSAKSAGIQSITVPTVLFRAWMM